jgi:hypothetical protein
MSFAGPGAYRLGEERDADAHQLAPVAFLGLLAAQLVVARHLHGQPQRGLVVPESYTQPVLDVYGNCSGRSRFFSRSSAGSIFSSSARQSTMRSTR